jgi:hypothetical protein
MKNENYDRWRSLPSMKPDFWVTVRIDKMNESTSSGFLQISVQSAIAVFGIHRHQQWPWSIPVTCIIIN